MWARPDLLAELKGLGLLRSPALERSFLHVRQESFLPDAFGTLAYADMPLPVHVSPSPPTMPSARCLIAALGLLEPFSDLRVLIAGCRGGYPGALLAEIVGPDRVVVVETDEERRTRASRRLQAAGFEAVRVLPALPPETFDRILVLDATPPRQLVPLLADPAFLIARGRGVHDLAFVKLVRQGGEAVQAAYILQSAGELERAADAYERSIRLEATAEAHTFHGWALSFMGRYDAAIEECKRAIEVDPSFGNPYNDIGAYLIELERLDEAIPWLERAISAPRYCCYFYAHTNLARVYLQKGLREKARRALRQALDVNPEYEPAQELLRRIERESGYFG